MAGQSFIDQRTGKPIFIREGKAYLKDQAGNIFRVNPDASAERILSGEFEPASMEDVQRRDIAKRAGDSPVRAFGEAAAAGAFDAATAVGRVGAEAVSQITPAFGSAPAPGETPGQERQLAERAPTGVSGRDVLEAVAAGGDAEAGERYAEEARHRAAESPLAAMGGRVAGEVAGIALGGLAGRAAGAADVLATQMAPGLAARAAGAVGEGAVLGYAQANEDAYIQNRELTAEQTLASMGLGGVFGGGVALGLGGAARVFGRRGTRGETPFDSPKLGPYRTQAEGMEQAASKALGAPAAPGLGEKLLDAVESAQSAVSGADKGTLRSFGATRWDAPARRGRDMWRDREGILEGASRQMRDDLDTLATSSRDVMDEVVDADLKRGNVAGKLTGDQAVMVQAARAELGRVRADVDALLGNVQTFGNRGVLKRIKQFTDEFSAAAERTDDAAEAFIALDKTKRGLQRWRKQLGRSAARSDDALLRQQADALGNQLETIQERTRKTLMDEAVWGQAAADQRAINAAWENWFQSRNVFHGNFLTKTGDTFDGRGIFVADPNKISRYVRNLGKQEAALVDEQFRHHVIATRNLADAIDGAFDVGEKAAQVKAVRAAAEQIEKTLAKADETVKVANQIDAVIQAEAASGSQLFSGAIGGGILGGIPGAIAGAAFGVLSRPGQLIKQAAAIQALSNNVNARMRKAIGSYFKSFSTPTLPSAGAVAKRLPGRRTVTAAGIASFAKPGEDKRTAYARRVREVMAVVGQPEVAAEKVKKALGPLNTQTPKLAGMMGVKAMAGAAFLAKKIDRPLREPSLTPHLEEPSASDSEIADFARYWSAVSNPMSLMDELKAGTLTHEHVEAVQAVYPKLFAEMQLAVMDELAQLKKQPPYQARLQLDMLMALNGAGEESVSPGFLMRQQQRSQAAPSAAATPAGRAPGPKRPLESSAKNLTTSTQALEARDRNR